MKKRLLICAMVLFSIGTFAQDTLTGWTFPTNSGPDSLNANLGTTQNKGYDLRFQWVLTPTSDSTLNTIIFYNEAGNYAAETEGWDNGQDVKFWSIKFKAPDYINIKVSSKQKGDIAYPGPRDFKMQWRLSSTSYEDIPNGALTLSYDYADGSITNLPVAVADQGTGSVYIRWIMTSNTNIDGQPVTSGGRSIIDDILVTGVSTLGTNDIIYTNRVKFLPGSGSGQYQVESTVPMASVTVTDLQGRVIFSENNPGMKSSVILGSISKGIYLVAVRFTDSDQPYIQKFLVK